MFKPSLKRSKFTQISTYSFTAPITIRQSIYRDKQFLRQKLESPDIHIPSLLSDSEKKKQTFLGPRIITPLNSWNLSYPSEVKQKLNMPIQQVKSRLIGSKYGVYWLVTQNTVYLWRYNSVKNPSQIILERKFQFQRNLRQVAIGHLDNQECQFLNMSENTQIMAVGFDHIIDLYSINLKNLQLKPIDIRFRVQYKQTLQKLQITDSNQIYYTGDQGYLTKISFKSFSKSDARPSVFHSQSILPSLITNKANMKVITQKILITQNKIYVLLRKESQGSWLYKLGLSVMKFLSGKIKIDESSINIEKQIHVYSVTDKEKTSIRFSGIITNKEIQKSLRQSFSSKERLTQYISNDQAQKLNANSEHPSITNSIVNIFPYKKRDKENQQHINSNWISISLNSGIFINIRENFAESRSGGYNFCFQGEPKKFPMELFQINTRDRSTALFLKGSGKLILQTKPNEQLKQQQFQPLITPQFKVIFSLGEQNINFVNNGLCFYFDNEQIQIVKLDKYPGYIVQTEAELPNTNFETHPMWLIFSKEQITVIRKCQYYQYILATLNALNQQQGRTKQKKQNVQECQHNSNETMYQLSDMLGVKRLCKQLCKLLLEINKLKLQPIQRKGEIIMRINNQIIQTAISEQKINLRLRNSIRLKIQLFSNEQKNILFMRWMSPRSKQLKLDKIQIQQDLQLMIWKYFVLYALERSQQNKNIVVPSHIIPTDPNEKILQIIPPYPGFLIKLFRYYYSLIKDIDITSLRRSPKKIKEIKDYLISLMNLLQQKQAKQKKLLHNFMLLGFQNEIALKKNQTNKTNDSLSLSTLETYQVKNEAQNNQPYSLLTYRQTESATQEISNQICKVIPKLLHIIELYEILASNSQKKYDSLPKINDFLSNFYAKRQVKQAFLDLFSTTDISVSETIAKFRKALPQLGLQADIFLSKWIKFIYRTQSPQQLKQKTLFTTLQLSSINKSLAQQINQKTIAENSKPSIKQIKSLTTHKKIQNNLSVPISVSREIRISNLEQLSRTLQIEQIQKIRGLFEDNSSLYMKILIKKLEFRKIQFEMVTEIGKNKLEFKQENNLYMKDFNTFSSTQSSVFSVDRKKAYSQWKSWISEQIILIRQQMQKYLKMLALTVENSPPSQFLHRQKLFDETTKLVIENCSQGAQLIKILVEFIKKQKIIPEKIYKLSSAIDPAFEQKKIVSNLLRQEEKPQNMNTFTMITAQVKAQQNFWENKQGPTKNKKQNRDIKQKQKQKQGEKQRLNSKQKPEKQKEKQKSKHLQKQKQEQKQRQNSNEKSKSKQKQKSKSNQKQIHKSKTKPGLVEKEKESQKQKQRQKLKPKSLQKPIIGEINRPNSKQTHVS